MLFHSDSSFTHIDSHKISQGSQTRATICRIFIAHILSVIMKPILDCSHFNKNKKVPINDTIRSPLVIMSLVLSFQTFDRMVNEFQFPTTVVSRFHVLLTETSWKWHSSQFWKSFPTVSCRYIFFKLSAGPGDDALWAAIISLSHWKLWFFRLITSKHWRVTWLLFLLAIKTGSSKIMQPGWHYSHTGLFQTG